MNISLGRIAAIVLLAGVCAADAAPNVPPSAQPGRERYRFTPSPLDPFFEPSRPSEPLIRWECHDPNTSRAKPRGKRNKNC